MRSIPPFLLLWVLSLALAACGYHLPGGGGGFPAGITSVYLQPDPPGSPLAHALSQALRQDPSVQWVEQEGAAGGILRIQGGEMEVHQVGIGSEGVATAYEVRVTADYHLVKGAGGAVVNSQRGLEVRKTYPYNPATNNPAAEAVNQRRAARQAAQELAREILTAIKEPT